MPSEENYNKKTYCFPLQSVIGHDVRIYFLDKPSFIVMSARYFSISTDKLILNDWLKFWKIYTAGWDGHWSAQNSLNYCLRKALK